MKFSKFIVIPSFIAFLAFTMQTIDQTISGFFPPAGDGGFGWIAFQAWPVYFLAGCTVKGGVRAFLGYVSGVVASIAIMVLGVFFGFMTYIKGATFGGAAVSELFYCLFGLVYGYVTVLFRGWYEAKVAEKTAIPAGKKAIA